VIKALPLVCARLVAFLMYSSMIESGDSDLLGLLWRNSIVTLAIAKIS